MQPSTNRQIVAAAQAWDLGPDARAYLSFHARRYELLLGMVEAPLDVLDIGPFLQTQMLRERLPSARVHTIAEPSAPAANWGEDRAGERHVGFDLNRAHDDWPEIPPCDLVVLAEVLEHLHTAPQHVLRRLAGQLKPGGRLIVQTPNAARLDARLRLLAGRNPYEMIREATGNPGHFREYTHKELNHLLRHAGLTPVRWVAANYFAYPHGPRRALAAATAKGPPSLRDGITVLASLA